jgi:hypothetical protein
MCKSSSTVLTAMVAVAALVALGGCVTPIEVKQASKAQLDLITALDSAAADLQQSLAQFNQSIATRIREDGRIRIAAQAIEVAYPQMSNADVTSDALFKGHEASVQPWIDNALISQDIDATIAQIQDQKKKTTNPALQIQLDNEEQDLQKRKLSLANKPPQVREIEGVIVNNLNSQLKTATEINKVLDILRAQIAVMKQMAARVDAWLAIDVTVTQEQADALRAAFSAAASSVGAGK